MRRGEGNDWPGEDLAYSKLLASLVQEDVEKARTEIFGQPSPPFSTKEEAIAWLESQPPSVPLSDKDKARWDELVNLSREVTLHFEAAGRHGLTINVGLEQALISYPKGEWTGRIVASTHQLVKLSNVARDIAKAAGWEEQQASMHLLMGGIPLVSKVRLTESTNWSRIRGLSRSAVLSFTNPNVRRKDLEKTYRFVSRALGMEKRPRLDGVDQAFLDLVDELGPAPGPGERGRVSSYWKEFMARWNRLCETDIRLEDKEYNHWTGPQKMYRRIIERLGSGTVLRKTDNKEGSEERSLHGQGRR